jgi:hypothetical protein
MSPYFWFIALFCVPVFLFCCGVFLKKINKGALKLIGTILCLVSSILIFPCGYYYLTLGYDGRAAGFFILLVLFGINYYIKYLSENNKKQYKTNSIDVSINEPAIPRKEHENEHESDVVDIIFDNKWKCGECGNINEIYLISCKKCGKYYKDK